MIICKKVEIVGNPKTLKHYKDLGYEISVGKKINVKIKDLTLGSHVKILAKCDVCGLEKKLMYQKYINNTNNYHNQYCCSDKCANNKRKNTVNLKYGVDCVGQLELFKNKIKETCLDKYKTDNVSKSVYIKEKIKKTNNKKYGGNSSMCSKEIREKAKQTNLKLYGHENASSSEEIKLKKEKTCLKNHGVTCSLKSQKIREKCKQTCMEKYGVEYPAQNKNIFNKIEKNSLKICTHQKTKLQYQGKYEEDFLNYCVKNNIVVEKVKSIKYVFNGENKIYYPDFYLKDKNLIIEIKSNYFYKKYLNKNLAKQKFCIKQGYNFIFIIDKNYSEFNYILNKFILT